MKNLERAAVGTAVALPANARRCAQLHLRAAADRPARFALREENQWTPSPAAFATLPRKESRRMRRAKNGEAPAESRAREFPFVETLLRQRCRKICIPRAARRRPAREFFRGLLFFERKARARNRALPASLRGRLDKNGRRRRVN